MQTTLLSLLIWLHIVGGVLVMALGDQRLAAARWLALLTSLATLALCVPLYQGFDGSTAAFQFQQSLPWIPAFNATYHLGVDGIALPLIILTAFITVPVVIAAWNSVTRRVAQYLAAFLIMEGLMIGVFSAMDALLFYFFWEAMLIPMFLIIGIWGGPRRIYATIKFFLYTFLGSVFMLVALIYMYLKTQDYGIAAMQALPLTLVEQRWIFLSFFAAFAVKVPMWPVHTWLPDAHVEAPTGGSVVLAAITLKVGAYGFLRFVLPIVPDASHELAGFMIFLSLVAVVYIGLVALVQADMKKLIAYSSIAHMGFVTLGLFIFNQLGIEGGLIQMISHGFVSGAMFLCVGVMYDRVHSRQIADYGGVANTMPKFAAFFMLFAMANAGLPATSGFVGEFMVILGTIQANFWYAALAATTLIFGAAYTLWMYKRVVFGKIANDHVAELQDINSREFLVLALLAILVLGMGVYPLPVTDVMHSSVENLLAHVAHSKLIN